MSRQRGIAILWVADELLQHHSEPPNGPLIHEFLDELEGFERKMLLGSLFWNALRFGKWLLAEHCIVEGYPIAHSEDDRDSQPLCDAMSILEDRPDVIAWLLEHGAEFEQRSINHWTPLMFAVIHGYREIVELLLAAGADINASTIIDDDLTPLMMAAERGGEATLKLLLAADADVRKKNRCGMDAAQLAEQKRFPHLAALLRQHAQQR
ncbi:MAG: ankyrin repeat domain-containing protein [Planctomycetaceae bacterium]|nr:ankyrin repeat domain-containing protein [Planctomycetaceae bacterium]